MQFRVEDIRLAGLGVVFRSQVALLFWTVGSKTLARVMDPADNVVKIRFLANLGKIRCKGATHLTIAFADGVTAKTATRFEQLFAAPGISPLLSGNLAVKGVLPKIRSDCFNLIAGIIVGFHS